MGFRTLWQTGRRDGNWITHPAIREIHYASWTIVHMSYLPYHSPACYQKHPTNCAKWHSLWAEQIFSTFNVDGTSKWHISLQWGLDGCVKEVQKQKKGDSSLSPLISNTTGALSLQCLFWDITIHSVHNLIWILILRSWYDIFSSHKKKYFQIIHKTLIMINKIVLSDSEVVL